MLNGKKILIVEDSRTIKLQIKMMLEQEGMLVEEAGSEWGLFNKIEEYGVLVDLIIMDLVLNYEDGLELIEKLKAIPRYAQIPILILTEKVEISSIMKAKDLGVKCYLRKPVQKEDLISRIKQLLGNINSI